jgi:hypothetical protein
MRSYIQLLVSVSKLGADNLPEERVENQLGCFQSRTSSAPPSSQLWVVARVLLYPTSCSCLDSYYFKIIFLYFSTSIHFIYSIRSWFGGELSKSTLTWITDLARKTRKSIDHRFVFRTLATSNVKFSTEQSFSKNNLALSVSSAAEGWVVTHPLGTVRAGGSARLKKNWPRTD